MSRRKRGPRIQARTKSASAIRSTTEVPDNDATRGMVRQVRFLVSVEEVPPTGKAAAGKDAAGKDAAGKDAAGGQEKE